MPTYEYQCDACEHNFDELQSFSDAPLKKCPKCGKAKLRRVIGPGAGVIFKGSGFYQTDYRSESYKNAAKADQESGKPAAETKAAADVATDKGSKVAGSNGSGGKDSAKGTGKSTKSKT